MTVLSVNPHYNFPLTKDGYRFVHYFRNGEFWKFSIHRARFFQDQLFTKGFGWTAIWTVFPQKESRQEYRTRLRLES